MKARRQKKILEIIEQRDIATQEELAEALQEAGFNITQATVSRDIKELRLIKVATGENTYKYAPSREDGVAVDGNRLRRVMREFVKSYDHSENIIVLKTYPGNAHGVASLIDGAGWKEVIGTVAGDDTILMVVKTRPDVEILLQRIKSILE